LMNRINFLVALTLIVNIPGLGLAQSRPAYETEIWGPGRTLVWAHPGQDGVLNDPNNWRLADGTTATTPPDRHTDVLLPAAEFMYSVKGHRTDQVRHLTVEQNGMFGGKHRDEVEIWGNAHLKAGGFAYYVSVRGDKHTFFKLDESDFPTPENKKVVHHTSRFMKWDRRCQGHIAHKFQVCKYGTASVELIGKFGISDEIMVQHGRMIVSDELRYSGATAKGALEVFDGGILELQSGACVAPFTPDNRKCVYNVNIYRNGTLQAGSPERPLTRDARLLLGYAEQDQPGRSGLYAAMGSTMRVYTTDPKTARLVVSATSSDPTFYDGKGERIGDPDRVAQGSTGIALLLGGDMHLDGVHFDYVCQRGIGVVGAQQPAPWANVTWGSHNAGAPSTLFGEPAANANVYYHPRSDQRSEYGLTVTAVAEMKAHLEKTDPFRIRSLPPSTTAPAGTVNSRPVLQVETATEAKAIPPEHDVFLQNGQPSNSGDLRVRPGNRIAYLKFYVSGLSGGIRDATLRLTESGDPGQGTLRVYRGAHNNWTEDTITAADAPAKDGEIDRHSGTVDAGQTVKFDLSTLITENGIYSLIVEMDKGGNDISFASKDNIGRGTMTRPQAVIFHEPIDVSIQTRVPGAKIRYTLDGSEPVKTSPVYSDPIHLTETTRITAKAYKPGMGFSAAFSATYVFTNK
jgi:hypothetical protein